MKKITSTLRVCFFGTYDNTYTSNLLTIRGLKSNGAQVVEVNAHVKVTTLNKQSEMGWWQLVKRVLKKYRILTVIVKNWSVFSQVDVLYVGYPGHFDVFFAVILGKIFHIPVVFNPLLIFYIGFVEEQKILSPDSLLARFIKWGESLVYQSVDLVIADTPFQQALLMKEFGVAPDKIVSVPIGADDKVYRYTPYTNIKGKKLHVVYYGLYSPIHGVEHIIDAAQALQKNSAIHFTMVGNGQTFQPNFDRAKKLTLTNITFHHDLPESEHIAILQQADVFLGFLAKHPTVERVIPNKVYQGLSLGKVVLTADSPVIRSVLTHRKTVFTIPPADSLALVKALEELSRNASLRSSIATEGYQLFLHKFTAQAVGKQLLESMHNIIKK